MAISSGIQKFFLCLFICLPCLKWQKIYYTQNQALDEIYVRYNGCNHFEKLLAKPLVIEDTKNLNVVVETTPGSQLSLANNSNAMFHHSVSANPTQSSIQNGNGKLDDEDELTELEETDDNIQDGTELYDVEGEEGGYSSDEDEVSLSPR